MFKTLVFLPENGFLCVSADTKTWACWLYVLAALQLTTCGSPQNLRLWTQDYRLKTFDSPILHSTFSTLNCRFNYTKLSLYVQ